MEEEKEDDKQEEGEKKIEEKYKGSEGEGEKRNDRKNVFVVVMRRHNINVSKCAVIHARS